VSEQYTHLGSHNSSHNIYANTV